MDQTRERRIFWQPPASLVRFFSSRRGVILITAFLALLLFLSTLQVGVNGSPHRYATDVGEIQNALPRWGTIHFTGYPLYTALGSLFVNALQLLGVAPAAAASLYSALWGAVSIGLLAWLILELDAPPPVAAVASLLFALSVSMWVDSSLAELHSMTMALTFAALLAAVRFYQEADPAALYWLAFLSGQGVAHQRAFAFLAPALALLALPYWRKALQRWLPILGLILLGPLTYLYLPLVDWLGADWVFSAPGTWQGFWALLLDTKAERIISIPASGAELATRLRAVIGLLNADWPWPLWVGGLLSLSFLGKMRPLERLALALPWLAYFLVSLIIWEGYISDALLAVKLPVIAMAAVGLGVLGDALWRFRPLAGRLALAGLGIVAAFLFFAHRPTVLAITRHPGAAETIALVEDVPRPADGRPVTFMALWGNDYWQLAYAQKYQDAFTWLNLVDHDTNFAAIVEQGDHLYTLSRTFYERPLSWWKARLGPVSLSSPAYGVVEIRPASSSSVASGPPRLALENGVAIQEVEPVWIDADTLEVEILWRALRPLGTDYSVAVHLLRVDPPAGPADLLDQDDRSHPVDGWYPTSRWRAGEVVRDHYRLQIPPGEEEPAAVRIGMYRQVEDGFENSAWLSLPIPPRS